MSQCSTEHKNDAETQEKKIHIFVLLFKRIMLISTREVCFILALFLTAYGAFQSGSLRSQAPGLPETFFSLTSLVEDFPFGNLRDALDKASTSEISLLMYYAPWDAESQEVRQELENVARHFFDKVLVIGINCWYPKGSCRKRFSKIPHYPVLVLYRRSSSGIVYKGVKTAPYIIRFLNEAFKPLLQLHMPSYLQDLLFLHDSVIYGYFDFSSWERVEPSRLYRVFHEASLQALSEDPYREIAFAVISDGKVAEALNVSLHEIHLRMWNQTLVHPVNESLTVSSLLKWIRERNQQVIEWITPLGRKSDQLSFFLQERPTLILFTPRNPLLPSNPDYDLVRQMGALYADCHGTESVKYFIEGLGHHREESKRRYSHLAAECEEWLEKKLELHFKNTPPQKEQGECQMSSQECCQCAVAGLYPENMCHVCTRGGCHKLGGENLLSSVNQLKHLDRTCQEIWLSSSPFESVSVCCTHNLSFPISLGLPTPWSLVKSKMETQAQAVASQHDDCIGAMMQERLASQCRTFLLAKSYFPIPDFIDDETGPSKHAGNADIHGLGCGNKSLAFIAVDSILFPEFSERLEVGINNKSLVGETRVVIIDNTAECHFSMGGDLTKESLKAFIYNYTHGKLSRPLKSHGPHIHHLCPETSSSLCVTELTSETFHEIAMDPEKAVIVFYYTPWCGFCTSASYVYLEVKKLVGDVVPWLHFTRIDSQSNPLPWHFTMESFPTILFLPRYRKDNSRVFPPDQPLTVSNLLHFILSNVGNEVHSTLALRQCASDDTSCRSRSVLLIRDRIQSLLALFRLLSKRLQHPSSFSSAHLKEEQQKIFDTLVHLHHMLWAFEVPFSDPP